ncbi:hypothetical protein [Cognatiluteimonas telluris]|uniref:hypothetical protein n=1 Tax=Cognatiluteimonas telluris TaxID=1104775 RepID=UPI0014093D47|nr:hypothetical protein [Lysobacter telluris]
MPYTMQLDRDRGLLDLRYHGVVSIAQRLQAADEAVPLLRESGVRRILIDLIGAVAAPDAIDDFRAFATRITGEPVFRQSRTAFIAPPVNYTNHLIEVLVDAHHYPFSRFVDRDAAIAWLLGDEPTCGLAD